MYNKLKEINKTTFNDNVSFRTNSWTVSMNFRTEARLQMALGWTCNKKLGYRTSSSRHLCQHVVVTE